MSTPLYMVAERYIQWYELFKEQVLDEVYDSKLARLLQQVYKDDTERKFVKRALKQGEKVLGNPNLRGYALDLIMKQLKAVQDDPSTYNRIKDKLNPELDIRGVLLTMFDKRNRLSSQVETEARNFFKNMIRV